MVNLNHLRYFYICAQCGTFTKAATRLRLSQPSLSIQIKSFEEQLGFHLFLRTGRFLQLTPRGQSLYLYASKIFEVTEDIEEFLSKSEAPTHGSLKIGVSDQVERPFVAEIVGRLIKANSSKKLMPSIVSKPHEEMVKLVAREDVDLVITNQKTSELKLLGVLSIPVLLITGNMTAHSKVQKLSLPNLFKLIGQDLILPTNEMILAKESMAFLKQQGVRIPVMLTSNIIACITRSVQEKLGAAFLPVIYVQRELKTKSLQAFGPKEGFWKHHLYLYTYRGNENNFASSLAKIFQDFEGVPAAPADEVLNL